MTGKDWIIISAISMVGLLVMQKKSFADVSPSVEKLKTANKAELAISVTADELKVMNYTEIMWNTGITWGIEPAVIAGIMKQESSGNPSAIRNEPSINDKSIGLMQTLTSTASFIKTKYPQVAYTGNPVDLYIPAVSIELGTAYLKYQLDIYKKTPKVNPITDMIAAYNAGVVRLAPDSFVYVNGKGKANVQNYVDKVVDNIYRFRMMFTYLYSYNTYQNKFPSGVWNLKQTPQSFFG